MLELLVFAFSSYFAMETNSLAIIYALNLHSSLESTMLDYNIFVFCCVHQINSLHRQLNTMSTIHHINLLCTNQHVIAFLLLKYNNLLSLSSNEGLLKWPFLTKYLLTLLLMSFGVCCIVLLNTWKVYEISSLLTSFSIRVFEDVLILLFLYIRQYYCWHFTKLGTSCACSTSSCLINS